MTPAMPDSFKRPHYRTYLLRLWRDEGGGAWHASLQAADGGERIGFASLEHLMAHLLRETNDAEDADQGNDDLN